MRLPSATSGTLQELLSAAPDGAAPCGPLRPPCAWLGRSPPAASRRRQPLEQAAAAGLGGSGSPGSLPTDATGSAASSLRQRHPGPGPALPQPADTGTREATPESGPAWPQLRAGTGSSPGSGVYLATAVLICKPGHRRSPEGKPALMGGPQPGLSRRWPQTPASLWELPARPPRDTQRVSCRPGSLHPAQGGRGRPWPVLLPGFLTGGPKAPSPQPPACSAAFSFPRSEGLLPLILRLRGMVSCGCMCCVCTKGLNKDAGLCGSGSLSTLSLATSLSVNFGRALACGGWGVLSSLCIQLTFTQSPSTCRAGVRVDTCPCTNRGSGEVGEQSV